VQGRLLDVFAARYIYLENNENVKICRGMWIGFSADVPEEALSSGY
jgi:hypothetical protein